MFYCMFGLDVYSRNVIFDVDALQFGAHCFILGTDQFKQTVLCSIQARKKRES